MTKHTAGPVEDLKWAEKLQASVVTSGLRPKIHGYDVRGEMAGRASFSEVIFLSLTGELPNKTVLKTFDCAMCFLAPVSVAEAPVHAAVLSGLCGSGTGGITGVAAVTLAEKARWTVSHHMKLLSALSDRTSALPEQYISENSAEKNETALLVNAAESAGSSVPETFRELKPVSAAIAVLFQCCGIAEPRILETLITIASLPCTLAEGMAVKPGNFRTYPIELPRFSYSSAE